MAIKGNIRESIRKITGFGILGEAALLSGINLYLISYFPITDLFSNKIFSQNIIAVLTSSVIAIGFLYYIGYILALKISGRREQIKIPFQYSIARNGVILSLAIFLALLYAKQSNIMWYILINILSVVFFGFLNEISVSLGGNHYPLVTLTMMPTGETPKCEIKEGLKISGKTSEYFEFEDENKNICIIPIGRVKEMIIHNSIEEDPDPTPVPDSDKLQKAL